MAARTAWTGISLQGFFPVGGRGVARRKIWLVLAFLLFGLPAGTGLALMTPMGGVSDEPSHLARAEGLLYGEILGHKQPGGPNAGNTGAGVFVDISAVPVALVEMFPTLHGAHLPRAAREQARAVRWTGQKFYFPTQMVQYFPALYAPATAGLWLGRALGGSPLRSAFLARLCMLASYLAMGAAALGLARFGEPLLFALLLLPVPLMLGASFSQDGQIIAATALAAALLTRSGPKPGLAWGAALALLTLVACSKPPYAIFLGLCLLPLIRSRFWARFCIAGAACALPLGWVWLMTRCCYTNWPTLPYHPGPLWPGPLGLTLAGKDVAMNLQVLSAHPAQIIILPLRLLAEDGARLWLNMLGAFNWNNVSLPPWQIWGWSLALVSACLACMGQTVLGPRLREAIFSLALIAMVYVGVALALYLSFTHVGWARIEGVQGRYLLPLLPALVFVLPRGLLGQKAVFLGLIPALAMGAADIFALPLFSWHLYGMIGP